ncbi:Bromodomain-containing protein 1 [Babesia microti strain RI]|uniref:Bromodomain-containing protein 1 n=1 Tax=Babesia microti (strain RI) TaxID=1133968 RepID=A0A1R4AC04_BABMR|nr:Bromodomain-containing protein 1 [Babesia microti strain RI]SJK86542.1 Bromodomain-containing protein 1 [Babesia microti strain RI]|eukprot:XP_012649230.2 Bromodomain-containing protein 1 [Babesia microti strain RI]
MELQREGVRQSNLRRGNVELNEMMESHIILVDMLQKLIKFDKQKIFRYPVSVKLAPDYYRIIKNPMDFETMLKKLDAKQYNDFNDFVDDIRLIVSNAKLYNAQNTIFYQSAISLEHQLNKIWPRFYKKYSIAAASDAKNIKHQTYQYTMDNKPVPSPEASVKRKRGKGKMENKIDYKLPIYIPDESIKSILGTQDNYTSSLQKLGNTLVECQRLTKIPLPLSILIPQLIPPSIPMPSIEAAMASRLKNEISGSQYTNSIKNFIGSQHLDKLYSIYPSIKGVLAKFDKTYVSTTPLNDLSMFGIEEIPNNYNMQVDMNAVCNLLLQLEGAKKQS